VRLWPNGEVLVVRIDQGDKEFLIERDPAVYFSTPHYDGYPAVLVRLAAVTDEELGRVLEASWRYVRGDRSQR
jgi:hypothetical protein